MSTTPQTQPAISIPVPPGQRELRVYSHSALFYWWPVWACGFIMALVTWIDGQRLAIVPTATKVVHNAKIETEPGESTVRDAMVLPKGHTVESEKGDPHLYIARSKNLGVVFAIVLLVTIVITNVPLRGLWSVIIVFFIVLLTLIFALAGIWDEILRYLGLLQIYINLGGYFFISAVLLIIWAFTVFVFDHRTYVVIAPGQVRVCLAVGAGETAYDTTGMTFQKRQDDLFRHWIVGLGSGDLIIHRTNTNQEIDMPNVLFIGAKIKEIESLMKEREVV